MDALYLRRDDPCDKIRIEHLSQNFTNLQVLRAKSTWKALSAPTPSSLTGVLFIINSEKPMPGRLRLASLQIVLRHSSAQTTVPNRLAQVGSSYYDPFSGLPMLWSPMQQKIYSVEKDRYEDGADASFDISVPAAVSPAAGPKNRSRLPQPAQPIAATHHCSRASLSILLAPIA
jgi:hypothetical protein